jgi:hypothetical protein
MEWLQTVVWDEDRGARLALDTDPVLSCTDPNLIFENDMDLTATSAAAAGSSAAAAAAAAASAAGGGAVRRRAMRDLSRLPADFYNLSNDRHYGAQKSQRKVHGVVKITHCLPALRLSELWFKLHPRVTPPDRWHRPMAGPGPIVTSSVPNSLYVEAKRKGAAAQAEWAALPPSRRQPFITESGPGPMTLTPASDRPDEVVLDGDAYGNATYVPKLKAELTNASGRVLMFEYMEQYPPLVSVHGMQSRLLTYYRKTDVDDLKSPDVRMRCTRPVSLGYRFPQ